MCGIAGFVSFKVGAPANPSAVLRSMTDSLHHRGPDGEGFWSQGNVHLGHRRLSVIDIRTGSQPMESSDGTVIAFNGEIYNYREIRKDLETKGRHFQTESDTEVLLQAFEEWGEDCLERLNGMFAFAIWDPTRNAMFIARDRLGKKPFYYYSCQDFFAFASELKGLMAIPEIKGAVEIDARSISDYLSLGYILAPKSIFKQIKKLPPATSGWLCTKSGKLSTQRYWKLEDFYLAEKLPDNNATTEAFRELLFNAVNIRLHADVPLAGFLSGGIDSAAVMAGIVQNGSQNIHGLCMGFAEDSFDESIRAKSTAKHLGIPLDMLDHQHVADDDLAHLIWHTDEPFGDTSMVPTFQLCQAAKEKITVALSGDGADEILAGYSIYQADRLFRIYQYIPAPLQHLFNALSRRVLKPSYKKVSFDYKARQFLGAAGKSRREAHYWWRNVFSEDEKTQLISPELQEELQGYSPFQAFDALHEKVSNIGFLDQCLYVDTMTWLPDDILVKVDRMSMASGVEVRSPFLDHRLVEFAAQLPESMKYGKGRTKTILRDAMGPYLSDKIVKGPKRGFNAPVSRTQGLSFKESAANDLFNSDFKLHPEQEDVTFKLFVLSGLDSWLKMERNYKLSGEWTHGKKDKSS